MSNAITSVLQLCPPVQITQVVVFAVAVSVAGVEVFAGPRPNKDLKKEHMQKVLLSSKAYKLVSPLVGLFFYGRAVDRHISGSAHHCNDISASVFSVFLHDLFLAKICLIQKALVPSHDVCKNLAAYSDFVFIRLNSRAAEDANRPGRGKAVAARLDVDGGGIADNAAVEQVGERAARAFCNIRKSRVGVSGG